MKIALLSEKYTPDVGGLAISAERLARLLASAGHSLHVFSPTLSLSGFERRTVDMNGIAVTRFGAHKRVDDTLQAWFELVVDEHKRQRFDLLHAYFLVQAGFVTAYAGKYLQVPSVVSARGNDLERAVFDPSRAAHILYALRNASAVTANASELARKARALVPGLHVGVIPNGVDTDRFRPALRNNALAESLNLINRGRAGQAWRVIGFAGELREKKGLHPLLGAYAQVIKQLPAALLIVGEVRAGEDSRALEEFRQLHPECHIIVTGTMPAGDMPAYYSVMDVFVQPSLRDGLPNALLEAMACGKAVIGTTAGGIPDILTDGVNGRIVSTNHTEDLAETIRDLLADEEQRRRLGMAACQTIRSRFTLRQELDGNQAVYRRLGLPL